MRTTVKYLATAVVSALAVSGANCFSTVDLFLSLQRKDRPRLSGTFKFIDILPHDLARYFLYSCLELARAWSLFYFLLWLAVLDVTMSGAAVAILEVSELTDNRLSAAGFFTGCLASQV